MPIQIGDLVTVRNNKVEIRQLEPHNPLRTHYEPIEIQINKGLIFEVLEVYKETKAARILPIDYRFTNEYIIITEIDNLHKCGRAVNILYGKKST